MYLQAKEFQWVTSVNKWSYVKCSDVEWTDVIHVKWFCFEFKWNEVSYGEVLADKSTMHISATYSEGTWLYCGFYLVYIFYCGCFNLFYNLRGKYVSVL
jgi:hypothetical protein